MGGILGRLQGGPHWVHQGPNRVSRSNQTTVSFGGGAMPCKCFLNFLLLLFCNFYLYTNPDTFWIYLYTILPHWFNKKIKSLNVIFIKIGNIDQKIGLNCFLFFMIKNYDKLWFQRSFSRILCSFIFRIILIACWMTSWMYTSWEALLLSWTFLQNIHVLISPRPRPCKKIVNI